MSIRFNLKLYFLKVDQTTTKTSLLALLSERGCTQDCMICIEDAESAFQPDAEIKQDEGAARPGPNGMMMHPGMADDESEYGGMGMGMGMGMGVPHGASSQRVSAKVFVDIIRGEGSSPPDKRLIFFSTNHVDKMPLEIKELTDQQGARTNFPNCNKEMTSSMFDLFFQTSGTDAAAPAQPSDEAASGGGGTEGLAHHHDTFLANLESAPWFAGFDDSNVSGASLSEFLQRHRGDPRQAASSVSGTTPDCLQVVVESNPTYRTADAVAPRADRSTQKGAHAAAAAAKGRACGGSGGGGAASEAEAAALPADVGGAGQVLPLRFGLDLSVVWVIILVIALVYIVATTELMIQAHPIAMTALAVAASGVHMVSYKNWQKIVCSTAVFAICESRPSPCPVASVALPRAGPTPTVQSIAAACLCLQYPRGCQRLRFGADWLYHGVSLRGPAVCAARQGTLDCDGDGNVWVLDSMDDTSLCVEQGMASLQRNACVGLRAVLAVRAGVAFFRLCRRRVGV